MLFDSLPRTTSVVALWSPSFVVFVSNRGGADRGETYGITAITEELHEGPAEIVIGLNKESSGSWKTRHLKVRAFHLREVVRLHELCIEHIPGSQQLGDLGTKAFHKPRLQELLACRA